MGKHMVLLSFGVLIGCAAGSEPTGSYDSDAEPSGEDPGGGGGNGGAAETEPSPPSTPSISGFRIKLAAGPRWRFLYTSVWKGATTVCHDTYRLSGPESRAGLQSYRVTVSSQCGTDPVSEYAPNVEWVAIDGERFMGSQDGTNFYALFDAQLGRWPGNSGFFNRVDGGGVKIASTASFHGQSVYSVRWDTSNGCQTLPGYGEVCGSADPARVAHMTEYWNLTDGPVGYVYNGCVTGGCIDDEVHPE